MVNYVLRVIDFETTGIPSDDAQHSVVEAGWVDIIPKIKTIYDAQTFFVVPITPMDIEALAVHHISEDYAKEKGCSWDFVKEKLTGNMVDTKYIYVAHNADFEKNFFNPENSIWIDTYKVALKLYQDAPRHSNNVLKYYLGIEDTHSHHPPHRALPDCFVTADILIKMSENLKFNEMINISKEPPYLTKIKFGKHYGKRFDEVPRDYLEWIMTSDMDEGVKAAAQRVLHAD